jgi:molybdenum cofactor cytidylyltransferase
MVDRKLETTAIILAAGQSKRMGKANKLLTLWHGKPLLEYVCKAALGSVCERVIVVTGHDQRDIKNALKNENVFFTHNKDYASGMASSIKAGLREVTNSGHRGALILLGDMPEITSTMINQIIEAGSASEKDAIIVSTSNHRRGNPLLWKELYFEELQKLKGDKGASQIISKYQDKIIEVELGSPARFDLDTPQAFVIDSSK